MLALDQLGLLDLGPQDANAVLDATETDSVVAQAKEKTSFAVALKGPLLTPAYAAQEPFGELPQSESPLLVPEPRPARRFAYVPDRVLLLSELDMTALSATGALNPLVASENPEFWASETRQERAAVEKMPPIVALPGPGSRAGMPTAKLDDKTLNERLAQLSPEAGRRLREKFIESKVAWPPAEVSLVAIKSERVLELYARSSEGQDWQFVHSYPVLAASGDSGPKLRKGDKQVPEGVYGISFLNPNSRYHVSLRVNYPNKFDRDMAKLDGRTDLGGDIMIHGKAVSAGCLAVGDEAAEELFVLAAHVGLPNVKVIIAPTDFREETPEVASGQPKWLPTLYVDVASAMTPLKRPSTGLLSFFGN